jgi:hypothetical protein
MRFAFGEKPNFVFDIDFGVSVVFRGKCNSAFSGVEAEVWSAAKGGL